MNLYTRLVLLIAVAAVALLSASCGTQPAGHEDDVHEGALLYERACSACHGMNAHGNGPVAPFLTLPVPDLTLIAQRRGDVFPEVEIFRIIDGQSDLRVHGPRQMPVWGYEFFEPEMDDEEGHREATRKIDSLVSYLRSIQRAE